MKHREVLINVTKPALPPLAEFIDYLEQIWENKILTNEGPFHIQFEEALKEFLGVNHLSLLSSGTIALLLALRSLDIKGEVITTPFSFAATTHAIWYNNLKPVFVDIEPEYYTIDPEKIEAAITKDTTAIVPVHIYGNPCRINEIQEIADSYGLKVIYDAAHAFGVKLSGTSILNAGDLSILSFHATKVFNTFEGGCIISKDEETKKKIDSLKNFGISDQYTISEPGLNGKMNELQASFGLLQLKYIGDHISKRESIVRTYRHLLEDIPGIRFLNDINGISHNYSYFPILVDPLLFGRTSSELYTWLSQYKIFCRRYYYPLLSHSAAYSGLPSARAENLHVAETISSQVLCLPLYPDLEISDVIKISNLILSFYKKR